MANTDAQPDLTPAEDNPWYLLATLHGVPAQHSGKHQAENRAAWNRYFASQWTDELRERLKGRVAAEELRPFDDQELLDIRRKFADRAGDRQIDLPYTHDDVVNFKSCFFQHPVSFQQYVFVRADFRSSTFARSTDFGRATFVGSANFESATFAGYTNFKSATFGDWADFESATFDWHAGFESATFAGYTNFSRATFTRRPVFESATFAWYATFSDAAFAREADFNSATFSYKVDFTNADMKAPTDFTGCRFQKYPPQFPGAKLHEGTVWRGVSWPRPPVDPDDAGLFTDAYERLKLEMDRLKKHEDELMFFAKELQCRRVAAGWFRGLPIAAYGVLCDYGRNYLWPLLWLLGLILVGAVPFWWVQGLDILMSLGVSTANTLAALGLRKELVDPDVLKDLSRWLRVLSGVQMVMGLVLLFLFGLGLRNRFRMK